MGEQQWYYLTQSWEDKDVPTIPKGISLKVNIIVQIEYTSRLQFSTSAITQ